MQHLKIVELASVLAGPAVGMFFAELGAEVIKIEHKATGGDMTRKWRLPNEPRDTPYSAYYASINYGKTPLLLDLYDRTDQQIAFEYLRDADVVISNFKASSAREMGMDAATIHGYNPRAIYAQLNAFDDDPDRPAFDVVLQAEAGFLYMNGEPNRPPVKMPVALIDILAAHQLKEGILVALLQRERTGKGCIVTTSLLRAAVASLANQAANWLMCGHIPQPIGTKHPNIAPYGDVFACADNRDIVLAVGTDRQFQSLCDAIGLPELAQNVLFSTNPSRVENRSDLNAALQTAIMGFDRDNLLSSLVTQRVPAGSIRDMREVFEQPAAQQMILNYTLPDGTAATCVRTVAFDIAG